MRIRTFCALLVVLSGSTLPGQIFDADFNAITPGLVLTQPITEPLPLKWPTNVVLDFPFEGDTIDVVTEAGDLDDQPVLLDARPGGISWGAFLTPTVYSSGAFSVSWDSLVLDVPASGDPGPFDGVLLVTRTGDPSNPSTLQVIERWEMRYTPERTLEISDAVGIRTFGAYTAGEADHFDLDFDLDSGAWDLEVNGSPLASGTLLPPFEFGGTIFMANGRQQTSDPPPLVMDNFLVEQITLPPVLLGDYNASGRVEQADLDLVLLNWGDQTPPVPDGWIADLPSGAIDQQELDAVLLGWGTTSAAALSAPEPSTAALIAVVACLMTGAWAHVRHYSEHRGD